MLDACVGARGLGVHVGEAVSEAHLPDVLVDEREGVPPELCRATMPPSRRHRRRRSRWSKFALKDANWFNLRPVVWPQIDEEDCNSKLDLP